MVSASNVFCAISFHSEITAGSAAALLVIVSSAVAVAGAVTISEVRRTAAVPLANDRRTPR